MSAPRIDARLLTALAILYGVWSSTYFAIHVVVAHFPPLVSAGVRYAIAGCVLLAIARARGLAGVSSAGWRAAVVPAFLLFVMGNGFVTIASRAIPSGVVAVACGSMPLWAAAFGPLFGARTRMMEWLGLGIGFVGTLALAWTDELRDAPLAGLLLLASPAAWALGSHLVRRAPELRGMAGSGVQMIVGGALTGIAGLMHGETPYLVGPPRAFLGLAYLCVFGSILGYSAYNYVLEHARPAVATSYAYVNPLLAVLVGVWLGGEEISASTLTGLVLTLIAIALIVQPTRTPQAPREVRA